ncbi:MAG: YitT family protein, partial [Clostridia bacterium]|nr:YitT family protein [Clostridia bacterium]
MKKIVTWKKIARVLMITLGGVIGGAGLSVFLEPHNLAPGGVSGIAIILGNFIP